MERIRGLVSTKTIIVVSHSSALVSEMTTEAVWLHRGKVRMQGEVDTVSDAYKAFLDSQAKQLNFKATKKSDGYLEAHNWPLTRL